MKFISTSLLLLTIAGSVACGEAATQEPATGDSPPAASTEQASSNILETAAAAGSFKTLAAAIDAAGLTETLSGPGPFTVFAPTDEAFAKLPPGTVEDLLKTENKQKLVAVLTYHVVPGNVMAKDVVTSSKLKSVQGQELTVRVEGSAVSIDGATVVKTDIAASNGVIHVIDSVVLPK
ncbi:MAG TPA: fasciclin domain-containing protein [Polyangiaceae bacterium]|nr:fasciclin domain-containing protein [Polyangiaceae bacterium]